MEGGHWHSGNGSLRRTGYRSCVVITWSPLTGIVYFWYSIGIAARFRQVRPDWDVIVASNSWSWDGEQSIPSTPGIP